MVVCGGGLHRMADKSKVIACWLLSDKNKSQENNILKKFFTLIMVMDETIKQ